MHFRLLAASAALLTVLIAQISAHAAEPMPKLTGNIAIHDPSIVATPTGWSSFATGVERAADGGMPRTKFSPDGIAWAETGAIPGGLPAWIEPELGYKPRNLWAPSVSLHQGTAYLYYSASSFGRNDSAIGLMLNRDFHAADPAHGWEDQGLVIRSHAGDNFNAIDPYRIDTDGKAWLAFGSFWDGIRLVALDPASGKLLPGAEPIRIASRGGGAIEAPSILSANGHFYLFVAFDACCRGTASTYRTMVGRADKVDGPYLDRDGKPLTSGGGTQLLATTGRYHGPGGAEIFEVDGKPWLAFHYYDADGGGMPRLQVTPLSFDAEGWPVLPRLPGVE